MLTLLAAVILGQPLYMPITVCLLKDDAVQIVQVYEKDGLDEANKVFTQLPCENHELLFIPQQVLYGVKLRVIQITTPYGQLYWITDLPIDGLREVTK